jgi:hypothetical protein
MTATAFAVGLLLLAAPLVSSTPFVTCDGCKNMSDCPQSSYVGSRACVEAEGFCGPSCDVVIRVATSDAPLAGQSIFDARLIHFDDEYVCNSWVGRPVLFVAEKAFCLVSPTISVVGKGTQKVKLVVNNANQILYETIVYSMVIIV